MTSYTTARIATNFMKKLFIQFFVNYYATAWQNIKQETSAGRNTTITKRGVDAIGTNR